MKVRIIVDDKKVIVDGRAADLPDVDWGRLAGDPDNPWDDVSAVWYDSETNQGHIEFYEVVTKQPHRPNIKPPDLRINTEDFQRDYGWILEPYYAALGRQEAADNAARDKQAKEAARAAALAQEQMLKQDSERQAATEVKVPFNEQIQSLVELVAKQAEDIAALKAQIGASS